jgi:hypothetical protein
MNELIQGFKISPGSKTTIHQDITSEHGVVEGGSRAISIIMGDNPDICRFLKQVNMDLNHNEDGGWTWLIAAAWGWTCH